MNHFKLLSIIKHEDGEDIIMRYIPDPGDPKYDDLPSEQLHPGKEYDVEFKELEPEPEREFNR